MAAPPGLTSAVGRVVGQVRQILRTQHTPCGWPGGVISSKRNSSASISVTGGLRHGPGRYAADAETGLGLDELGIRTAELATRASTFFSSTRRSPEVMTSTATSSALRRKMMMLLAIWPLMPMPRHRPPAARARGIAEHDGCVGWFNSFSPRHPLHALQEDSGSPRCGSLPPSTPAALPVHVANGRCHPGIGLALQNIADEFASTSLSRSMPVSIPSRSAGRPHLRRHVAGGTLGVGAAPRPATEDWKFHAHRSIAARVLDSA